MRVRRRLSPEIRLIPAKGDPKKLKLSTRYRWADSFGMNLLLFVYAPVGWTIDWMTGAAWQIEDPPLQRLGKSTHKPIHRKPSVVAVAPPQGIDVGAADALGLAIDSKLRSSEHFNVLDYEETSSIFQFYHSYDGLTEDKHNRYRLFSELEADHILHSKAERKEDRFLVRSELKDVVTGHTHTTYNWEIVPGTDLVANKYTARTLINKYFHIIPNTVFWNVSDYTPTLTAGDYQFDGKESESEDLGDEIAKYLSAISIARLEREQFNTRGHWVFAFVPTIIASQKRIEFPTYEPAIGAKFHRWYLSGGYGVEGGYMGRYGFVYVDFIPMLTWSKIQYSTPRDRGEVTGLSVQPMVELGYSYFFTDHLIGRIFFRNLGEDEQLWNEAFSNIHGRAVETNEISSGYAGFSIGYYIPSSPNRRDSWLVRRTSRRK